MAHGRAIHTVAGRTAIGIRMPLIIASHIRNGAIGAGEHRVDHRMVG